MFAYNATSAEEEARRAILVDACEGLSSLCSQWHGSEYNKLKFGEKGRSRLESYQADPGMASQTEQNAHDPARFYSGAPVQYCPLTIAAPQHVQSIMMAQAMYEKEIYAAEDAYGNDSLASSTGSESSFATSRTSQKDGATTVDGDSRLFETVTEPDVRASSGCQGQALENAMEQGLQRSMDGSWVKDVDPSVPSEAESAQEKAIEVQRHNPTNETPLRVMLPQSMEQEEGYEGMAVNSVKGDEIEFKNGQHLDMPYGTGEHDRDQKIQMELKQAMEDEIRANSTGPNGMQGLQLAPGQEAKQFTTKTSDTHPIK
jgi:hypothetical protein